MRCMAEAAKSPALTNLDTDLILDKPQIKVTLDRQRVADLGLSRRCHRAHAGDRCSAGARSRASTMNGEQYDVVVQVAGDDRDTPQDLQSIYLRGRDGAIVQLSSVVTIDETVAPKELNRFNQLRAATITAVPAPGYSLGDALAALEEAAGAGAARHACRSTMPGQSREFKQSGASILLVFLLALGFIYLVLAAQFESFVDPLVIMLSVPLSLTGALAALYLHRRHVERLQPDRPGHADRPDHQARHPDRRVHQPAARPGPGAARRAGRGGDAAPAADPDDHGRDGAGRRAAGARDAARAPKAARRSAG